ncbi:MAG TPA: cytochrome c3 family protein [Desulfuromonadales bacterium]|nr:cytochrome c3 family protein [Desulfuromonadales bacterium]
MVFLVLNATGVRAAQKPSACVTCHSTLGGAFSKPVAEWHGSVHQQVGVTCDSCHGGNAAVAVGNVKQLSGTQFESKRLAAMSKSHGFVARPSGKALFDMCAKCHADTVARFAESIMGKAYLENKGGPSCLTCHHAHNNVIPDVPKVCTQCHKDTTGFTQIDPMNVTDATIARLSTIRIRLAGEKAQGSRPSLVPKVPEELDPYQVGLLAFGGVLVLFLIGLLIFVILEKEE